MLTYADVCYAFRGRDLDMLLLHVIGLLALLLLVQELLLLVQEYKY